MKSLNRLISAIIISAMLVSQPTTVIASETEPISDVWEPVTLETGTMADVPLTGIKLSTESVKVGKGEKVNLEVKYTPQNATNREVEWSSSNSSVATVDKNGLVEAKSNGNAVITARAKSGDFKATCSVTVSDQAAPNLKKLDFGGNQEVSADKKIPLVGGKKYKLELPEDIPVTCIIEDGRIKVGINFKKEQLYSYNSATGATTSMKGKNTKEQFEDLEKNLKKAASYASADKWIQMAQEKKFDKAAVPGLTKAVTLDVLGYAEGKWSDGLDKIEGTLIVRLKGEATVQGQYMVWVIPVTVNCKFTASSSLIASVGYNFKDAKWYGDLGFAASIGIEPYAGVGFGKWMSGGVYGNATTDVKFTLKSSTKPTGLDEWNLSGEAGLKGYFAQLEFKQKIISGKWNIYTRSGAKANKITADKSERELDEYPDYTEEICAVGTISEMSFSSVAPDGTLLENVYPAANPEVITVGDTTMLLYVKNVLSDNNINRTDLVYRLYDSETNQYGEIKSVSSNTTADCEPKIYTDKNDIYVAWLDSNKNLSSSDELYKAITADQIDPEKAIEYMKTFGIRVSKYDRANDTFENIGTPSWNENFIYSPEMCMTSEGLNIIWVENTETVPWTKNSNKSDFVTSTSNIIHRSVYADGVWTEMETIEGLDDVSDLAIGNTSTGVEIAYVIDKEIGQTLYVSKADGSTETLTPDGYITTLSYTDIPSLKDKGIVLTMNMDGGLYYLDSSEITEILPEGTMCGSSDYEVYGGRIYYLQDCVQNDIDSRNVGVSVWDEGTNEYGSVFLTHEEGYVDSFTNQTGKLAYLYTDAKYDINKNDWNTSASIKILDSLDYHDLELEDVDYSPSYAYPGMDFPIDMYITNNGTDTVSNAKYSVNLGDKEIANGTLDLNLLPGDMEVIEKTFRIPDDYMTTGGDFTVSVKMDGDRNPSNDSKTFSLFKANLTVSSERETVGNRQYIIINVENSGLRDSNTFTKVLGEDGQELFNFEGLVKAGETATFRKEYAGVKEQTLTVETFGDVEEFYQKNNIDWVDVDDAIYDPVCTEYNMLPGEVRRMDLNSYGLYIYGVKWSIEYPDKKYKDCIALKNGVVMAKKNGKAVVKATYGNKEITFNITVDGTVSANKVISLGKKVLKISAPKSITLNGGLSENIITKKVSVSIPKELRSADVTVSSNILNDEEAFKIGEPQFNNADRTKASKAVFEITPRDTGASYVMWSVKDADGNEATAYTKVIVKKPNTDLYVENHDDITKMKLPVGEGVNLSVITTIGNTDPKLPSFSVKGNGFKISKSGLVIATKPGASGKVTVKFGNKKAEVLVSSAEKTSDKPFLIMSKPFIDINIPKASAKKDQTVTLKLSTPKKSIPDVIWEIVEYEHDGMDLDPISGKLTVSKNARPGSYTVICRAVDEDEGYNTALCEITLK